ncbi:hypothetical protein ACHAP8_002509 [Fusarium lateritium]
MQSFIVVLVIASQVELLPDTSHVIVLEIMEEIISRGSKRSFAQIALFMDGLPRVAPKVSPSTWRGHSAGEVATNLAYPGHEMLQPIQGLEELDLLMRYREDQSDCVLTPASNFSAVFEQSDRSSSAATWDTSSPERSPGTPLYFNPAQTPRAMVFATDDSDIEALPGGSLSGDAGPAKASAASELPPTTVAA